MDGLAVRPDDSDPESLREFDDNCERMADDMCTTTIPGGDGESPR